MKTETTIIRIDEDDAMRDKDDDDPPISIPFCNWYLIYDERFKERSVILNKIEGHGLLVRRDCYDVRDNWVATTLVWVFFELKLISDG